MQHASTDSDPAAAPRKPRVFQAEDSTDLRPASNTVPLRLVIENLMEHSDISKVVKEHTKWRGKSIKMVVGDVKIDELHVDAAYQRNANAAHIKAIMENFYRPACLPPIVCVRRYNKDEKAKEQGYEDDDADADAAKFAR